MNDLDNDMSVNVRPIRKEDAEAVVEIYSPIVEHTSISFELTPPDSNEMARRIQAVTENYPWLVAEKDGLIVGYAYASQYRARAAYQWSVESSVYVRDGFRKQGIAKTLYQALFKILKHMNFVNVYAGFTLPNEPSRNAHLKFGFKPVGVFRNVGYKFGTWHDVEWTQLTLTSPESPSIPKVWKEVESNFHSLLDLN